MIKDLKDPDGGFNHGSVMVDFIYKRMKTFVSRGKELFYEGRSIFLSKAEEKKPKRNCQETKRYK